MARSPDEEMNRLGAAIFVGSNPSEEVWNELRIRAIKESSVREDLQVWRTIIYIKKLLHGPETASEIG